ncbi:hypothetical protein P280DRAFT_467748 [Massarina eburnea CBS 473.64]|uniref:Uncharacterized protein n=1 Tax=Massarina eburnea CBS 473.64 TaxID=1395130 RepID=A0A6A6S453_9PLEO|nr:hypothetical protein P280DRAFT_467748 [Massarina eburnea CBS 473.64]
MAGTLLSPSRISKSCHLRTEKKTPYSYILLSHLPHTPLNEPIQSSNKTDPRQQPGAHKPSNPTHLPPQRTRQPPVHVSQQQEQQPCSAIS